MSKSKFEDFELGNLLMGNSRGPYNFPNRDIVNHESWQKLMKELNAEDYHASFSNEAYNWDTKQYETINPNTPFVYTEYGGIEVPRNGIVEFIINPYWWDDCTCGADDYNQSLWEKLEKEIFTEDELVIYEKSEDFCEDSCPAEHFQFDKSPEDLEKLCTCGTIKKNLEIRKEKLKIKDKIEKLNEEYEKQSKYHSDECMLVKHNFIWHPGQEDEFWIDWYKYPFRDSHMSSDKSEEEIIEIFEKCIKIVQEIK